MQGTIARVSDKGIGFVMSNVSHDQLFFHASNCAVGTVFDDLRDGDLVSFSVIDTKQGRSASDVRLVSSASWPPE